MQLRPFAGNKEKKARPRITSFYPGDSRPRSPSVLTGTVANSIIFRAQTRKVGLAEAEQQTSHREERPALKDAPAQPRPCPSQRQREAGTQTAPAAIKTRAGLHVRWVLSSTPLSLGHNSGNRKGRVCKQDTGFPLTCKLSMCSANVATGH